MPTYRVEQYEVHTQTYEVEAKSKALAIKKVIEGQGRAIDNSLEYIEVMEDFGMATDENEVLTEELEQLGVNLGNCDYIPSIRSIEEV